jgi:hypothetical protein
MVFLKNETETQLEEENRRRLCFFQFYQWRPRRR